MGPAWGRRGDGVGAAWRRRGGGMKADCSGVGAAWGRRFSPGVSENFAEKGQCVVNPQLRHSSQRQL